MALGSGGGAQVMMKAQGTWGGTFMASGQRSVPVKTVKTSIDPHYVQGGPYISGGQLAPLSSARIQTWQDAKLTITVDMMSSAMVPLLIATLGTGSLTQIGTTTAWGIGGATGVAASAPDLNSTFLDIQVNIPDDSGTLHPYNFHSCVVQKAEFVFDRAQIVTGSFDLIAQQVETSTGALTYTAPTSGIVFAQNNATATAGSSLPAHTSGLAFGVYNSEVSEPGIRKATITLDRKLQAEADRMYLGYQFQASPVTNDYVDLGVSLDVDYTSATAATLWTYVLGGNIISVLAQSVIGTVIGSTTSYPTFSLQIPAFGIDNPDAVPNVDGYKVVNTTMTGVGHIDPAGDPWLNCVYVTPDTAP